MHQKKPMFSAKFQTFDDVADPAASSSRLAGLRFNLKWDGVDGFILPRADRHQNEYVPPSEERLAWLTGFTGSAGFLIVLPDRAMLFTDGRYTLQAREQTDSSLFTIANSAETTPADWIEQQTDQPGTRIGYDPWLHTADAIERFAKACEKVGWELVALSRNPVDEIWKERPQPPLGEVTLHDVRFAGLDAETKLKNIAAEIGKARADAQVVSDPHNIAWAFNIRGADVAHTPLPIAFAILPKEGRPQLFIDGRKLSNTVRDRLGDLAEILPPEQLSDQVKKLAEAKSVLLLDKATAADALVKMIEQAGAKAIRAADPITAMKAIKNETEIAGARAAHVRDGAAMARFLAWFDHGAPNGRLTEIAAVEALESFAARAGCSRTYLFRAFPAPDRTARSCIIA